MGDGSAHDPDARLPGNAEDTPADDGHDHAASDCEWILQELDLFLDGELSEDARASIHTHLHACPDCFQAFDFHAELKTVIAAKCHNDELPPGLVERLEACLDTVLTDDAETTLAPTRDAGLTADES